VPIAANSPKCCNLLL